MHQDTMLTDDASDVAAPPLKAYRVFVHEWTVWDTVVEATSEEEAERLAEDLWNTCGDAAFDLFNTGNDGVTVGETVDGGG